MGGNKENLLLPLFLGILLLKIFLFVIKGISDFKIFFYEFFFL